MFTLEEYFTFTAKYADAIREVVGAHRRKVLQGYIRRSVGIVSITVNKRVQYV